jgi:acyl carrier protein
MKPDEIAARVRRIIARELRRSEGAIAADASFVRDLDADSLEIVQLVIAIEREFDVRIPDDDADRLQTVQDAVDYLRARLG